MLGDFIKQFQDFANVLIGTKCRLAGTKALMNLFMVITVDLKIQISFRC